MVTETIGEGLGEERTSGVIRLENSQSSLVEIIRSIGRMPDYVVADKRGAMRNAFEHTAQEYPLIGRVRDRETTFSDEYERIFGKYEGWRTLVPTRMPESLRQDGKEFAQIVGQRPLILDYNNQGKTLPANMIMTPLGCGVTGGFMMAYFLFAFGDDQALTISRIGGGAFVGGMMGAFVGLVVPFIETMSFHRMRESSAYLDRKIEEAYR